MNEYRKIYKNIELIGFVDSGFENARANPQSLATRG